MTHNADYLLWLETVRRIPPWEFTVAGLSVLFGLAFFVLHDLAGKRGLSIFRAFQSIKIKSRELDTAVKNSTYIEITIPRDSQASAFQIQQKILKAFHSAYSD